MLFSHDMSPEQIEGWISAKNKLEDSKFGSLPLTFTLDCSRETAERLKITLIDLGQGTASGMAYM